MAQLAVGTGTRPGVTPAPCHGVTGMLVAPGSAGGGTVRRCSAGTRGQHRSRAGSGGEAHSVGTFVRFH